MISGFALRVDGGVQTFNTIEQAVEQANRQGATFWIDLDKPTVEELSGIGEALGLNSEALEDCLEGEQRPRLDEFEDHIFLLLYGMVGPKESDAVGPRQLTAFCGRNYLITAHVAPLRTIQNMKKRCERRPDRVLSEGIDALLHSIIDGMADVYVGLADQYEERVDELEDRSLEPDVEQDVLQEAVAFRKELVGLRHLALSQRELLTPLSSGDCDYVSDSLGVRFSHVRDHLTKVIELIDSQRERLSMVRDNYHTALANRTNEIMKTLTLFATLVLPLSLIAGVYGMNVELWPPADSPSSFYIILVGMAAAAALLLYYFRRKYWI